MKSARSPESVRITPPGGGRGRAVTGTTLLTADRLIRRVLYAVLAVRSGARFRRASRLPGTRDGRATRRSGRGRRRARSVARAGRTQAESRDRIPWAASAGVRAPAGGGAVGPDTTACAARAAAPAHKLLVTQAAVRGRLTALLR